MLLNFERVMYFEIDMLGVYYFLWSLCMLFSVLAIGSVLSEFSKVSDSLSEFKRVSDSLNEFIRELSSVKSSLLDVHRGVCALDHTLKRMDQTTISAV